MRLQVGLTTLSGSIERYAERFDLLELRAEPGRLPSPKALKRIRSGAPKLAISFLFPSKVVATALDQPTALDPLVASADVAGAAWLVLQTGPDVGPSPRSRAKIEALVKHISRDERRIAWEPHGMWEEPVALEFALRLGIHYVQDLAVATGAQLESVYTRLRTPGPGAALRASALETLAEELAETEEAVIVVEGRPSQRARARIRRALTEAGVLDGPNGAPDDADEDGDEEELDDDELGDEDEDEDDAEADD